jgi:hypothetical protein
MTCTLTELHNSSSSTFSYLQHISPSKELKQRIKMRFRYSLTVAAYKIACKVGNLIVDGLQGSLIACRAIVGMGFPFRFGSLTKPTPYK